MNQRFYLILLAIAILAACWLAGCSKGEEPVPTGGADSVVVCYISTPLDTTDLVNSNVWDSVDEACIRIGESADHTNEFGLGLVRTKAICDSEYVYFRFSWTDTSQSVKPGYWIHEACGNSGVCDVWTQNWKDIIDTIITTTVDTTVVPNDTTVDTTIINTGIEEVNVFNPRWEREDIFALLIDNGSNGSEGANCFLMCHDAGGSDTMYLTGGGNIDAWVWRAGRTDPLGLAEDMFWGSDRLYDDAVDSIWWRNAKNPNANPEGDPPNRTVPKWAHRDRENYEGAFLFAEDTINQEFAGIDWQPYDGVPGYVLSHPATDTAQSRYDVKSASLYELEYGTRLKWTIVLWRKIDTGNGDDFAFEPGQVYEATVAIMDHTDQLHSGSKPFKIMF
ncbi:MAG: hypothetical protein KAT58_10595 [candidate division Zixibacteria bacterium]|nr:hypothetical protein [candidate division Zixibacteria bacterium]